MGVSNIGNIIKWKRTLLGLSQEDLADGICAVATLSRIENGERMPTQNHLELLLQRLGYSDVMLESYADENDFYAHELKFKIRQAHIEENPEYAKELLKQFEQMSAKRTNIDQQFVLHQKVLLDFYSYTNEERLPLLEEALRLTQPKYIRGQIPRLLSYEEIKLINSIALTIFAMGHKKQAIDMLYGVVAYYDAHMVNLEEILRTEPMILYNLSRLLGQANRYDECLEICSRGIHLAQTTGRSQCFHSTMYNKAWALVKRNLAEDLEEAKSLLHSAYHVAIAFKDERYAQHYLKFMEDNNLT